MLRAFWGLGGGEGLCGRVRWDVGQALLSRINHLVKAGGKGPQGLQVQRLGLRGLGCRVQGFRV